MIDLLERLRRERRLSIRYFVAAILLVLFAQWLLVPALPTPSPIPGDPDIAANQ